MDRLSFCYLPRTLQDHTTTTQIAANVSQLTAKSRSVVRVHDH